MYIPRTFGSPVAMEKRGWSVRWSTDRRRGRSRIERVDSDESRRSSLSFGDSRIGGCDC